MYIEEIITKETKKGICDLSLELIIRDPYFKERLQFIIWIKILKILQNLNNTA